MSEQKLSDWLAEWWPFALSTHEIGNAAAEKARALEAKLETITSLAEAVYKDWVGSQSCEELSDDWPNMWKLDDQLPKRQSEK